MSNKIEVAKSAEGAIGVVKDWAVLALTGLGINLAPHEFLGGLFLALAAAMVARNMAPERTNNELWLVLLTAFLAAVVTAEALPMFAPHWPTQLMMAAAGFFSRFAVQFLLGAARQVQKRTDDITDRLLDRALPPGDHPPARPVDKEPKP